MSSYVAAALRNTQLLQDTRERLRETEVLQRIAALTSATLELDEMLQVAVAEMAQALDAEGAHIFLPNVGHTALEPHMPSRYGIVLDWSSIAWPLDAAGHQVEVFQTGQPYVSNDPPTTSETPRRNIMTVPLNTRQGTLGIMSIINRKDGDFHPAHLDLAIAIASQIAVSIDSTRMFTQERNRADLMQVVNRISQEFSAVLDVRSLLRTAASNIHQHFHYDAVYAYLMDDSSGKLICQASEVSEDAYRLEPGTTLSIEDRLVNQAITTGTTQLIADLQKQKVPKHFAGMSLCLVLPLKRSASVLGVLVIWSHRADAFDEIEQAAIENLSSQASIALDNARLYNQAQQRLLEQSIVHQIGQDLTSILDYNELVNAIARHMSRALDASICVVAAYHPATNSLHIEAEYVQRGVNNPTREFEIGHHYRVVSYPEIEQVITTHRAVADYSKPGISQLIVPMPIGERITGVVIWTEQRRTRRFSPDDERLAQTLASQAAIALENARLFRESERRAREQALLRQVALSLSSSHGIDELVSRFATEARSALDATNVMISLMNDDGWLVIRARALTDRAPAHMALGKIHNPNTIPYAWKLLRQGDSIFIHEDGDRSEAHQEILALLPEVPGIGAIAAISHRGEMIGLIEIAADPTTSDFDVQSVQLLESLANQAALAIENVRLAEREQRRLQQMERIQKSSRLISSELVMQNLLELVVKEAAIIFDVPAVAVMMPDQFNLNYIVHAAYGLSEDFIDNRRLPVEEITADEVERRSPVYTVELSNASSGRQARLIKGEGLRSALSIPLVKGLKVFGTLELYSKGSIHRFRDEDGEIAQLLASQIAIALDNADLFKALEARAEELAEANRLKSQFLANVSHELRTPMNSILGFSETLLQGFHGDLNEQQGSRLEIILRNGRNLLTLIDDLLDISKIDAGRMELDIRDVDIREEIQAVVMVMDEQAASRRISISSTVPEDVPPVKADPLRLRQIITNLVSNAVKFTHEGGVSIAVETRTEVKLNPEPDEQPSTEVVWVSVKDTGIGIALEDQLIIFDEFRQADGSATRQYGGTGLGLAISRRLIEMMGGRIWVDSEPGQGSIFTFVLPTSRN
jgi:signal transduction histidine kinase/putative methionine-R-sulfoxide reductase with GAF domain